MHCRYMLAYLHPQLLLHTYIVHCTLYIVHCTLYVNAIVHLHAHIHI